LDNSHSNASGVAIGGWAGPVAAVLDGLAWLCMLVAGVAMVVIILAFGWLVYGRYVLNDTPTWVEAMSLLLVSWITFLGAAVGVWRNGHLSIDFVRESLPVIPRIVMRYASDILMLAFGATMAWEGTWLFTSNLRRIIPLLGLPEAWRMLPMAICGVLIVLFCSFNIAMRIAGGDRGGER